MRAKHATQKTAFTLVELLVTLAVIAILAALLLPALSSAKFHARDIQCRNNLRQIALATAAYTSTHNVFPIAWEMGLTPLLGGSKNWFDVIELPQPNEPLTISLLNGPYKFSRRGGVFHCPFDLGSFETIEYRIGSGLAVGTRAKSMLPSFNSYGYNDLGMGDASSSFYGLGGSWGRLPKDFNYGRIVPLKDTMVVAPSDMLAFGDHFSRSRNPTYDALVQSTVIRPWTGYFSGGQYGIVFPLKKQPTFLNHHQRANRAFVDGHIAVEDLRKTFRASDEELRHWNYDNLPHRERLQD